MLIKRLAHRAALQNTPFSAKSLPKHFFSQSNILKKPVFATEVDLAASETQA